MSELILYLDLILLLNFIMNSLILVLTSYLARINVSFPRLCFGAIVATASVPFLFIFPNNFMFTFSWKLLFSIFILLATFGFLHIKRFFHVFLLFYFVSFTAGGGLTAIQYMVNDLFMSSFQSFLLTVDNIYGESVHVSLLIVSIPLVFLLFKNRMDQHVKEKIKYDEMYECILTINGKSYRTNGFFDSGNHLVDPITNRPIVLADVHLLQHFFSATEWQKIMRMVEENDHSLVPDTLKTKLALIPYYGVGGKNGVLFSFAADKLTIFYQNKAIETERVLVGIQLHSLTGDERYHLLLHPQLVYLPTKETA